MEAIDLTSNMIAHGLLREHYPEVAAAMEAHGGPYEMYGHLGWSETTCPTFCPVNTYRVKPQPPTKPSIDWSNVAKEYKWLARDGDNTAWLYDEKPDAANRIWLGNGETHGEAATHASYTPGTCDWRDSLVERPADV